MRALTLALLAALVLALFLLGRVERSDALSTPPTAAKSPAPAAAAPASDEALERDPAASERPASAPAPKPKTAELHEILVLDQDRKPVAGIAYARSTDLDADRFFLRGASRTDAEGRGRLAGGEPGDERPYFARVEFHGPDAIGARIAPRADASFPVEIVLPLHGSVRVEAAPELSEYVRAGIALEGGGFEHGLAGAGATLDAGSARIPFVGLGHSWVVSLRPAVGGGALQRTIRGPQAAGEEVVVRFEAGADPVLTGILAGEDGTPLVGFEVERTLRGDGGTSRSNLLTDAEGRFVVPLTADRLEAGPDELEFRRYLELDGRGAGSHAPDPASAARAEIPRPMPRAKVDLGILRFAPEPVLASGRVRIRGGGPVAGAYLSVDEVLTTLPSGQVHWVSGDQFQGATSAEDGTFTIYGRDSGRDLRLRATARDQVAPPPRPIAYGETGIEILLEQAGAFEGRIEWTAGGTMNGLEFGLQMADGQLRTGGSMEGGTFAMLVKGLPPGTYDMVGRLAKQRLEFLRLPGIVIRPGETATDPRVQPLDLNPYLEMLTVAPRGPDGKLPPKCLIWQLRDGGTGGGGGSQFDREGIERLPLVAGGSVDLLIESPDLLLLHIPRARGALEPRLEPAVDVTIRLRGDVPLSNEHGAFRILAAPVPVAGMPPMLIRHATAAIQPGADRRARFQALLLGAWELDLIVPRKGPSGNAYSESLPLGKIEIGAGDGGRVYEMDLPEMPR